VVLYERFLGLFIKQLNSNLALSISSCEEVKMKKIRFILICSIFVLVPFLGDTFAQKKPVDIKEHVQYTNSSCGKVVSVKNDGSMPKYSLTQRFKIICEPKGRKGQTGEETIEITISKDGRITGAKVVGTTKAMGAGRVRVSAIAEGECDPGKTLRCAKVCYTAPPGGQGYCIEVCWCD
jgi:hypothetical protein